MKAASVGHHWSQFFKVDCKVASESDEGRCGVTGFFDRRLMLLFWAVYANLKMAPLAKRIKYDYEGMRGKLATVILANCLDAIRLQVDARLRALDALDQANALEHRRKLRKIRGPQSCQ